MLRGGATVTTVRKDNRSVARALEVLELFAKRGRPLFVTEMAKALNVPLSSCFLIVKTLERDGYQQDLIDGSIVEANANGG